MTKKYLKSVSRVKEAMDISEKFTHKVWNDLYEEFMEQQYLFSEECNIDGLRYHDHYSSFFYTISDREKFIESMHNSDYYSDFELVNKVYEKQLVLNAMEYNNKNYDLLDSWLDEQAKKLLEIYESVLHSYENPTKEQEEEMLEYLTEYAQLYNNYYIENNTVKLYHKAYTETL